MDTPCLLTQISATSRTSNFNGRGQSCSSIVLSANPVTRSGKLYVALENLFLWILQSLELDWHTQLYLASVVSPEEMMLATFVCREMNFYCTRNEFLIAICVSKWRQQTRRLISQSGHFAGIWWKLSLTVACNWLQMDTPCYFSSAASWYVPSKRVDVLSRHAWDLRDIAIWE